jgi:hypothetical protein
MPTTLRTSERTTFTTCKQKWHWAYNRNLRPKQESPHLRFGSLVHKALELRYPPGKKRGPHPAESFQFLYAAELREQESIGFRDEDGKWQEAGELGTALLTAFVEEFGEDDQFEVITSEQTFAVRVIKGLTYVGTFDGVWRDRLTGQLLLKEWKTAAQFWDRHLPLDEQAGSYWAFAPVWLRMNGLLGENDQLRGILYTFLRKGMPDDRRTNEEGLALNKDGTVSKRQPNPLFKRVPVYRDRKDRMNIRRRIVAQYHEMEELRKGERPIYKSPSNFNCATCPFSDPCELHETGGDYELLLRAAFDVVDQYSPYEILHEGK